MGTSHAKVHQIVTGIGLTGNAVTIVVSGVASASNLVAPVWAVHTTPAGVSWARFVVLDLLVYDTGNAATQNATLTYAATIMLAGRFTTNTNFAQTFYPGWPFIIDATNTLTWDGQVATNTSVVVGYWE